MEAHSSHESYLEDSASDADLAFLRAIEKAVPLGVYAVDGENRNCYVNDAFCRAVGWRREELLGRVPPYPFWPKEKEAEWRDVLLRHRLDHACRSGHEVMIRRKDGETFWAVLVSSPLGGDRMIPEGRVFAIFDITIRKRIEQELHASEAERQILYRLLVEAQEAERRRISAELHDSIGSGLSAVKFALEKKLRERSFDRANGTSIEDILEKLQGLIEESRRISKNLHPSIIEDLGIGPALSALCRETRKLHDHVDVKLRWDVTEGEVPPGRKLLIYRISQEALNNALKYSEGDRVTITLKCTDGTIILSVADNGRGMDLSDRGRPGDLTGGAGLKNMRERTRLSGGQFEIFSTPGQGTRIRATWPAEPSRENRRRTPE